MPATAVASSNITSALAVFTTGWSKTRRKSRLVEQADQVFARLATADGDIFQEMTSVAAALGAEATEIRGLLIKREETEAQKQLRDAQLKLLQLQKPLQGFIDEFSNLKSALGYVYRG